MKAFILRSASVYGSTRASSVALGTTAGSATLYWPAPHFAFEHVQKP
jgi:hypothetical protein